MSSELAFYIGGYPVELGPIWPLAVIRAELEAEIIALKPGQHMEVDMQYLLHRRLAIRQKQVHPFAVHPTFAKRRCNTMGDAKHVGTNLFIEIGQIGGVMVGNDQDVSRVDRLNIHDRSTQLAPIDGTIWRVSSEYFTKYAAVHLSPPDDQTTAKEPV